MIKSLRLVNWRSHSDTTLKFGSGTNLLVGIMGAGKSAVLDALSFALFGTFPLLERRRVKLEDVVRYNEPNAKVILDFSWNGNDYRIEREITKQKNRFSTKADAYRDGSLIETGTTIVTELVESAIGVDYDLFTRAIYSEQNNIDYFLSLDPKRRKEEFDRILGLDRFEKARAGAVSIANRFDAAAAAYADKYDENRVAELEKTINEFSGKENTLKDDIKFTSDSLKKIKIELKELSSAYESLEKKRKRLEELAKEIANLKGKISSLEDGLKKIDPEVYEKAKKELQEFRNKLDEYSKSVSENRKKKDAASNNLAVLESKIKDQEEKSERTKKLETALSQLFAGETLEKIRQTLADYEKQILDKTSEKNSESRKIQETKKVLEHLKEGISNCPLCESELGSEGVKKVRDKKEAEIKKSDENSLKLEKEIKGLQDKTVLLKERVRKIEFAEDKIATLKKELVDVAGFAENKKVIQSEISSLQDNIRKTEEEKSEVQKKVESLLVSIKDMEEMRRREETAKSLKENLLVFEAEKKQTDFDETAYEQSRKKLEEKKIEDEKFSSKSEYLSKELKLLEENKKLYENQLKEMKENKKKAEATMGLVEELKIYKNALLETQISLRRDLIEAINSGMNEIWNIFYPYGNYRSIRIEVTDRDYVFEVLEGDKWKILETVASGGERACAALTLRVALAMVLTPNLSWLILDEPTHNLDSEAVSLLSETLQIKVPQVVKQTFVITHEEALIGADFSTTYKLTRDKDHGGSTKTEIV